jgi:hypothetical protein
MVYVVIQDQTLSSFSGINTYSSPWCLLVLSIACHSGLGCASNITSISKILHWLFSMSLRIFPQISSWLVNYVTTSMICWNITFSSREPYLEFQTATSLSLYISFKSFTTYSTGHLVGLWLIICLPLLECKFPKPKDLYLFCWLMCHKHLEEHLTCIRYSINSHEWKNKIVHH